MAATTELAVSKTFRLSDRLSVEITFGPGGIVCEWDPTIPEHATAEEFRAYELAIQEVMGRLSIIFGGSVVRVVAI